MKYNKEKVAECIKEKSNWGVLDRVHKYDHNSFDVKKFKDTIKQASPKLDTLLQKIKELDEKDMKEHGHLFKHFIYSDIKSAYGAKLIAAGLTAAGFQHAYGLEKTNRGMSFVINKELLKKKTSNAFATLTSVVFYEKPIGINFRKDLLKQFNSRPDNNHGEQIRIIILDSGFREGVDLFDIKYVHLFEPIITRSDEKQAIGRATRFCGQKGLTFHREYGWPIHVYRYETKLTPLLKRYITSVNKELEVDTFFELFLKFSNIDPKKITFANELETVATGAAIDRDLTSEVHDFKIPSQSGGSYATLKEKINKKFKHLKWPKVKIENACVGGATILPFTPTQDFVRQYFTPTYPNPGMLLWHSVGTGKTCTAIATASSTFELQDYTIIYVTRYTLKGDVWKNMFDQACSVIIQDYLKSGKELPQAMAAKLRMLSKGWFEPMSYRQFSNLLEGKNQLSSKLIQLNGKTDPLRKTLVIIDEAHKLFAADVEGQEKADIDVIKKAFDHSNKTSGADGVKVLLMTATPYTSDPMDLMRLLNLIRPMNNKLPETFEDFSAVYLKEDGTFTQHGKDQFYEELSGYISYLNREKDIRSFSYPIKHDIHVPMSSYEYMDLLEPFLATKEKYNMELENYKSNKAYAEQDGFTLKKNLLQKLEEEFKSKYEEHKECLKYLKADVTKQQKEINKEYKELLKICDEKAKTQLKEITKQYKSIVKQLKDDLKQKLKAIKEPDEKEKLTQSLNNQIESLQLDEQFDKEQVYQNIDIQECKQKAKELYERKLQNVAVPRTKQQCDELYEAIKNEYKQREAAIEQHVKDSIQKALDDLAIDKQRVDNLYKKYKDLNSQLESAIQQDKSQQTGLEKCMDKIIKEPIYKIMLRGDSIMDQDDSVIEEMEDQGLEDNIFLVVGHGSEDVVHFNKRNVMPDDKVLVVFPVCSRPNFMDSGCKFMDMFMDPKMKKFLRNPIKYKREIIKELNRPIRIYLPGEYVPELGTNLFLNFEKETSVIAKSGVFRINKIPNITRSVMREAQNPSENLGSSLCKRFTGVINKPIDYTGKVHNEVFKGNLFKPASQKDSYTKLKHRNFKLDSIMKDVGPGIYYYIGCRVANKEATPEQYMGILEESEKQQEVSKRHKKIDPVMEKVKRVKGETEEESDSESESESEEEKEEVPPPKEKEIQLTKEEKQLIIKINKEVNRTWDTLENVPVLAKEWKESLEKITRTLKTVQLLEDINLLEKVYEQKESATQNLVVKDSNGFYKFIITNIIEYDNRKYSFNPSTIGYLPLNLTDQDNKCSSGLLKKIFVKEYQKSGIIPKLPTTQEAWKDNKEDLFNQLCKITRKKN